MDSNEIDKYFEGIDTSAPSSVEDEILRSSMKALKRSGLLRSTMKRTAWAAVFLVTGITIFNIGRLSVNNSDKPVVTYNQDETVTITVNKDFLSWIDAGNFFIQIDMKEKADEAFAQAISMIPNESIKITNQNDQTESKHIVCSLTNTETATLTTMAMVNIK